MDFALKTLDQIAIENGTDKATVFTRTYARPKGYTTHLEKFFAPLRDKPIKLLEIGIGGGESARTWLEFFEHGSIYGVDIVQNTNPYNTPKSGVHPRYDFRQGNQGDKTMWACLFADFGPDFDIIVDDGSHLPGDIITSFGCLWSTVRPGGFYVIEDLGCGFTSEGFPSHLDWIRGMAELMNSGHGDVDSIYLSRELAILTKTKT